MNETRHIESYLQQALPPEEQLLMEARLIVDSGLRDKVLWQQRSLELVQAYGRKQLRREIRKAERRLFSEQGFSAFRRLIGTIFQ